MEDDSKLIAYREQWVEKVLKTELMSRESMWTESVVVGSRHFIEDTKKQLGIMARGRKISDQNGICTLKDGLDWNGFAVYASRKSAIVGYDDHFIDGFVDANLQYWETDANRQFWAFGDTGDAKYVVNLKNNMFEEIDRTALDAINKFRSFDEMICRLLKRSLE